MENKGKWKRISKESEVALMALILYKQKQNTISTGFVPFTASSLEQIKKKSLAMMFPF